MVVPQHHRPLVYDRRIEIEELKTIPPGCRFEKVEEPGTWETRASWSVQLVFIVHYCIQTNFFHLTVGYDPTIMTVRMGFVGRGKEIALREFRSSSHVNCTVHTVKAKNTSSGSPSGHGHHRQSPCFFWFNPWNVSPSDEDLFILQQCTAWQVGRRTLTLTRCSLSPKECLLLVVHLAVKEPIAISVRTFSPCVAGIRKAKLWLPIGCF